MLVQKDHYVHICPYTNLPYAQIDHKSPEYIVTIADFFQVEISAS